MTDINKIYNDLNERTPVKYLFNYLVIAIILLWIFKQLDISLGILLGLVITYYIVLYINNNYQNDTKYKKDLIAEKYDQIRPKTKKIQNYDDIVDFLFSIQDIYVYNPAVYENIVDSIESFLVVYEETKISQEQSGINYSVLEKQKHDALNALHAMIYNTPTTNDMTIKVERAIEILDNIMNKYLDEIYKINTFNNMRDGMNNKSKILQSHNIPKPQNFFKDKINLLEKEPYTYNVF
jgi:hypothetical protein